MKTIMARTRSLMLRVARSGAQRNQCRIRGTRETRNLPLSRQRVAPLVACGDRHEGVDELIAASFIVAKIIDDRRAWHQSIALKHNDDCASLFALPHVLLS